MKDNNIKCIDLGSTKCPCALAYSNNCIYCRVLGKEENCQCHWQGVCVLSAMDRGKRHREAFEKFKKVEVLHSKTYGEDIKIFTVKVPKGFAIKSMGAGSYIFVKAIGREDKYSMPISIMNSNPKEGTISFAVKGVGPKSKALFNEDVEIEIKGIYSNGIVGVRRLERTLMNIDGSNRLINFFIRGLALAPLINILDIVNEYENYMIYLDDEGLNKDFVREKLGELQIIKMRKVSFPRDINALTTIALTKAEESKPLNVILSSDFYAKQFLNVDKEIVYANNSNICCGEGVCGSCTYTDEKGIVHRMCKEWS